MFDFYSYTSLKQQSAVRHVTPLRHIIIIPSQPVFPLSPLCCMLSGEGTNTNFIVFDLTQSGLEPNIYRTQGKHANHYITDAVVVIDTNGYMHIGNVKLRTSNYHRSQPLHPLCCQHVSKLFFVVKNV